MSPKRRRHRTRDTENITQCEEEVGLGVGSAAQRYAAYKAEAQAASSLRARWVSTLSFTPDPFQIQALDAVEAGSSVLVAAPTGAGKTIVGQFGAYVALEQGMQARGYKIIPVNPKAAGGQILGEKAYASLAEIPFPVTVFRSMADGLSVAADCGNVFGRQVLLCQ